jgi:hypothetical protein
VLGVIVEKATSDAEYRCVMKRIRYRQTQIFGGELWGASAEREMHALFQLTAY